MNRIEQEQKERYEKYLEDARQIGRDAGIAAASWVFDGNTDRETYARVLRGLEDGDPEILDSLPNPDLSGQWADDMTPRDLFEQVTGMDSHAESTWNYDAYQSLLDDLCTAWEEGAWEAIPQEIERVARLQLGLPSPDPLAEMRDKEYRLPSHAWPGGYPLFYLSSDGEILCPECANNGSDPAPVASDVHWEGPPLTCSDCGKEIESAYGEDES